MRTFLPLGFMLAVVAGLFAWSTTRANDDGALGTEKASEKQTRSVEMQELLDRIEALETRLAALEKREPLVRQADARQDQMIVRPRAVPNAVDKRAPADTDDDDSRQQTNGQKWSIRLLNHRNSRDN